MLIAEELLVAATDAAGRSLLPATRNVVLGGAYLTELGLRERLTVDEKGRLQVLEAGSTDDPLLDDALVRFVKQAGKKPQDVLDGIGGALLQPTLDSLVRRELVRPEPVKVLGLRIATRWPSVTTGPRRTVVADLAAVLTGARVPDERTGALVSLLHAASALHHVVPKDQRPGLTDRELRKRAAQVFEGRWAALSVTRAVEQAAAAVAAGGDGGGGGGE